MSNSAIEWTEQTWNPVTGCSKISEGCRNCYIERTVPFRINGRRFEGAEMIGSTTGITMHPERLDQPLRRRVPTTYFVNSLSDLFHVEVPAIFVAEIFAVMALTPRHTYQILTKRPGRARLLLADPEFRTMVDAHVEFLLDDYPVTPRCVDPMPWPLPNVWLGASVEDQDAAESRIRPLLETPAAIRFLSCEPLLGPVDLGNALIPDAHVQGDGQISIEATAALVQLVKAAGRQIGWTGIDWVIAGGESGSGARPMHPAWARSLRDQCLRADVPFHFKQWGEWLPLRDREHLDLPPGDRKWTTVDGVPMVRVGKKPAGRVLDGRTWDEMPERVTA